MTAGSLDNKKILRAAIQKRRDSLTEEKRAAASKRIAERFFRTEAYKNSRNILIFYPFRSEVNTVLIIERAFNDGKKIVLPRVEGKNLELYFVKDLKTQLRPGTFGIMEPDPRFCLKAKTSEIDLAVIPGVCFDRKMNRIGYGGGFYDKLIPSLGMHIIKIALCFEVQVLPSVPSETHDSKVDSIITEKKTYG